jgi:hypothetical protein
MLYIIKNDVSDDISLDAYNLIKENLTSVDLY